MQIFTTIADLRHWRRQQHATLGLVPTMGALHEGHLSLVRAARASSDLVAATIFVNPLQFAPTEDLAKYPRTFAEDCALLEREDVDILFAPSATEMYPTGAETFVDVPNIGSRLDGASRPGHFRGVATVVTKLFNILQPHHAYFGQKDAAQVAVLRTMVRDLNLPVDLRVCPTVRDTDGLALSSRNRYLTPTEREQALAIPRTLHCISQSISRGERSAVNLRDHLHQCLGKAEGLRLDYAELVDAATLLPVETVGPGTLVAIAAYAGTTRLIDNLLLPETEAQP
ncbi:pantoate--beta-alanine ligase [Granulicella sp. 5B5]|uniref:pantoate--beta-alanine ligase n=1 Tax=Granulicella sp. 5B5 TaxID=1617967 RepID=UPI0015F6BA3C|nr:pantoate--beta-alanine ligase [Granulicella sp. 5B5]QMV17348.1 pantoate--beta-alanine ligase [Granulicella sp. 5B5]